MRRGWQCSVSTSVKTCMARISLRIQDLQRGEEETAGFIGAAATHVLLYIMHSRPNMAKRADDGRTSASLIAPRTPLFASALLLCCKMTRTENPSCEEIMKATNPI